VLKNNIEVIKKALIAYLQGAPRSGQYPEATVFLRGLGI